MATAIFHDLIAAGNNGVLVGGVHTGEAISVRIPRAALRDANGAPLDQVGCLVVIEDSLDREHDAIDQPWETDPLNEEW